MKDIIEKSSFEISSKVKATFIAFIVVGILTFIWGQISGQTNEETLIRTWQTFLINVMFWWGISQAGVIFSVIWQLSDAKWGRPFKRLAEAFSAFLPISSVLFLVVFFGAEHLYQWTHTPFLHHGVAVKAAWLEINFFIIRNIVWLILLNAVSYVYVKYSLTPDFGLARTISKNWGGKLGDFLLSGYGQHETEVKRLEQTSRRIAPIFAIIYGLAGSFIVWDFIMTLDQEWFSTLFAVFVLVGNMFAALGILLAISVTVRNKFHLQEFITINRIHDMSKLILALSMLWTYMAFSQFIVIWYADMPEETPFLVIRSMHQPWSTMFVVLFFAQFVIVFLGLMPKTFCRTPNYVRVMGIFVAIGQWFSIYFLVVPSLQHIGHYHFYFGLTEILITLGFFGGFSICYLSFISKVPILPISDKHLCKTWHGH